MKVDFSYPFTQRALRTFYLPLFTLTFFVIIVPFIIYPPTIHVTKYIYVWVLALVFFLRSEEFWIKKKTLLDKITTILTWVTYFPIFLPIAAVCIIVVLSIRNSVYALAHLLSGFSLFIFGARLKIIGGIPDEEKYIILFNHCSVIDELIWCVFIFLRKFKVVYDPTIRRALFVSFFAKRFGIPVRRAEEKSIDCVKWEISKGIKKGFDILEAPEGSRLRLHEMKEGLRSFQPGAFLLSIRNKMPIIPVVIYWTIKFKPRNEKVFGGHWWWSPRTITIYCLDPVFPQECEKKEELQERVRNLMKSKLNELKMTGT